MVPHLCGKTVLCELSYFLVSKRTSIGVHKKPSPRLSTNLYDHVYFDRWDQFDLSMGQMAIPGQKILVRQVSIYVYFFEDRYLSLMSIVNSLHAREFEL